MENRIITKQAKKEQKKAFKEAMNREASQGACLRRLKQLAKQYEFFNLSTFQQHILDNQNECFKAVQAVYTKGMQRKVEQIELKKQLEAGKEVDLLIRESYSVTYENNGTEYTLKTFGSRERAEKEKKGLTLQNVSIVKKETPISTKFTPNEMLGRLQYLESKFYETFEEPKQITIAMILRAIGENVTEKDKEISTDKNHKTEVKKAS